MICSPWRVKKQTNQIRPFVFLEKLADHKLLSRLTDLYESMNFVLMPISELSCFHFCFFNQKLSLPIFLCLQVFLRQVYLFSTISQLMISQSMARCVAGCQRDPKSSLVHPLPPVYYTTAFCLQGTMLVFLKKLFCIWSGIGDLAFSKSDLRRNIMYVTTSQLLWTDGYLNQTSNCGLEFFDMTLVKSN